MQADLSAQWSKYHHFCEQMDPIKQRLQQVPQDSEQVGNIVCVCVCVRACVRARVYMYMRVVCLLASVVGRPGALRWFQSKIM